MNSLQTAAALVLLGARPDLLLLDVMLPIVLLTMKAELAHPQGTRARRGRLFTKP